MFTRYLHTDANAYVYIIAFKVSKAHVSLKLHYNIYSKKYFTFLVYKMENIDEGNVIVNQNVEKSDVMICETTATEKNDTVKLSKDINPNEQMEVTENKISTTEVVICEPTATEKTDTVQHSKDINPNEQMEVTENIISTTETEVAQETNIDPTPQEIELINKLRNFNTSITNPNSSSLNILNEYGSSSEDDSDDSSSSESSDSSSSSESDSDEDEVILNVKSAAKLG